MQVNHLLIDREEMDSSKQDRQTYRIKNTVTNQFIRLGKSETFQLLCSLKREEFIAELDLEDAEELPEELKKKLEEKFNEWGFLHADCVKKRKNVLEKIKKIHLVEFNVEKVLDKIYPVYSKCFSKKTLVLLISMYLIIIGFLGYGFIIAPSGVGTSSGNVAFQVTFLDIFVIILYTLASVFLHEFAHAVTCVKYGGKVKAMGIMLFYFTPCVYCDVSDVYTIGDRKKRDIVAISGVLTNLFIGAFLFLVAMVMGVCGYINYIVFLVSLFTMYIAIYNLIPFVKLDGYWIAAALSGMDNLMDKSVIVAYTCIFSRKNSARIHMKAGKKFVLSTFGICSLFFHSLFWFYTLISFQRFLGFDGIIKDAIQLFAFAFIIFDFIKNILYYYKMIRNDYERMLMLL